MVVTTDIIYTLRKNRGEPFTSLRSSESSVAGFPMKGVRRGLEIQRISDEGGVWKSEGFPMKGELRSP